MDAGVLLKGMLVVVLLGAIGLPMAVLATCLDNAIKNGSTRAAVAQASILTVCAAVILIIFFLERPLFFEEPWKWVVAFCVPTSAVGKWLNVREMYHQKRQTKSNEEGLAR